MSWRGLKPGVGTKQTYSDWNTLCTTILRIGWAQRMLLVIPTYLRWWSSRRTRSDKADGKAVWILLTMIISRWPGLVNANRRELSWHAPNISFNFFHLDIAFPCPSLLYSTVITSMGKETANLYVPYKSSFKCKDQWWYNFSCCDHVHGLKPCTMFHV